MRSLLLAIACLGLASAVPAPAPPTCSLEIQQNTHYPKLGYKDIKHSDQAACCAACMQDAKCGGFTLQSKGESNKVCHLKTLDMGNFGVAHGAVSGVKQCVAKLMTACLAAKDASVAKCRSCVAQNGALLHEAGCTVATGRRVIKRRFQSKHAQRYIQS